MRVRVGVALCWWMAVFACAGSPAGPARDASGPKYFQAHPKPGFSITASQKCECYACNQSHCCGGGDESTGDAGCGKDYTFTDCNMVIESCTTRCFQKVWRVPKEVACDTRRPAECCVGG